MKWDIKSILTLGFAAAVILLTGTLVVNAVITGDTDSLKSLIERFSTALISSATLALGYFFGRQKVTDTEQGDKSVK